MRCSKTTGRAAGANTGFHTPARSLLVCWRHYAAAAGCIITTAVESYAMYGYREVTASGSIAHGATPERGVARRRAGAVIAI